MTRRRFLDVLTILGALALTTAGWGIDWRLGLAIFGLIALGVGLTLNDGSGDEGT